jgi:hypothetical protein
MNDNEDLITAITELGKKIDQQNDLLAQFVKNQTNLKSRLMAGLWTGLGTVIGATVIVSGLVLALKPLANFKWISPVVKNVIDELEKRPMKPR